MMDTKTLTRDVGSILVGEEAVKEGLIHEVGTIKEAIAKLHELIEKNKHLCYTTVSYTHLLRLCRALIISQARKFATWQSA